MNVLKKWFHLIIAIIAFSGTSYAQDVDRSEPYGMMTAVSENLFERLKAENSDIREDPALLKVIVEEELMPYIDYRYAALKVLGPHLRKEKNRENVKEFVVAFRDYLVTSYAQVLTLYSDQSVQFEPAKAIDPTKKQASVKVDVIDAPRPDIKLEFKLRINKKTAEWLAFDMVAEGISLLSSKQSEWNSTIRKEGIPAVSQELIRLAAQPIRFEGENK